MQQKNENHFSKKLVVIACSTGGPKALGKIIPLLPPDLDCCFLVVQHMPSGFTLSLANRLNEISKIEVKEACNGELLRKNVVYIAKGGYQMELERIRCDNHKIVFTDEVGKNGLKPCADILFDSITLSNFNRIICVVLTGMGSDGTLGISKLKEHKDIYVIAQDEPTSTVFGMPKVIIDSGLTNEIVPLENIANTIIKNLGV